LFLLENLISSFFFFFLQHWFPETWKLAQKKNPAPKFYYIILVCMIWHIFIGGSFYCPNQMLIEQSSTTITRYTAVSCDKQNCFPGKNEVCKQSFTRQSKRPFHIWSLKFYDRVTYNIIRGLNSFLMHTLTTSLEMRFYSLK
jgi:hypothetical protein